MKCPKCGYCSPKKVSNSGFKNIYKRKDGTYRVKIKGDEFYELTLMDALKTRERVLEILKKKNRL